MNNILATIITFAVALAWLRLNDFAAQHGWISSDLSRKIIHIGTGPFYVLCWLLFTETPTARFLAALVPLTITLQFILVGTGVIHDEAAVRAMSRTGDRREILRGPLFYGIVFVVLTILYWRNTPVGIVALMLMCGGDGLADVFGRRIRSPRLPWNPGKSLVGSLAMFLGGFLFALVILGIYIWLGVFKGPASFYIPGLALIAFVGTLVESLPFRDIDNITVTMAAVILGYFVFPV